MDIIIQNFIKRNNININKIRTLKENRIYKLSEKNDIANRYGFYHEKKFTYVSIGDIIGYDYHKGGSNDLIEDMSNFFREKGCNYHTRSNGMLDYSADNIIEKIEHTFSSHPIVLNEADGNYFISDNGLHRYHILRLHYLNELSKINSEEEIQKLKDKYTIKVKSKSIDYIKTYCNYILSKIFYDYNLSKEYDSAGDRFTGRVEFTLNGKKIIMTEEELLNFTIEKFNKENFSDSDLYMLNIELENRCRRIPSFNNFMNEYFYNLSNRRKL